MDIWCRLRVLSLLPTPGLIPARHPGYRSPHSRVVAPQPTPYRRGFVVRAFKRRPVCLAHRFDKFRCSPKVHASHHRTAAESWRRSPRLWRRKAGDGLQPSSPRSRPAQCRTDASAVPPRTRGSDNRAGWSVAASRVLGSEMQKTPRGNAVVGHGV